MLPYSYYVFHRLKFNRWISFDFIRKNSWIKRWKNLLTILKNQSFELSDRVPVVKLPVGAYEYLVLVQTWMSQYEGELVMVIKMIRFIGISRSVFFHGEEPELNKDNHV